MLALLLQSVGFFDEMLGEACVLLAQLSVIYLKGDIRGLQALILFTLIIQTVESILFSHVVAVRTPNLLKERVLAFRVFAGSHLPDIFQPVVNLFIRPPQVGLTSRMLLSLLYELSLKFERIVKFALVLIFLVDELLFRCISHALLLDLAPFFLFALFVKGFI